MGTTETSRERRSVLVVDDEQSIRDSLRLLLQNNFEVHTAANGADAVAMLGSMTPDLVLLDVMMPKLDGIETLRAFRDNQKKMPVIMLTADHTVQSAVHAMKLGAVDYLSKPFDVESLTSLIINTLGAGNVVEPAIAQVSIPSGQVATRHTIKDIRGDFGALVGRSALMEEVFERVKTVAGCDTTVLITGESGTGKELIARQIHDLGARKDKPFVAINCAAIPETLIESELFGHEKGAFTSAVDKRVGYFELADGGTIFLDEIGELSLPVQVKMLRFLQEHEFYRVGQSKPVRVNVRIIAATNKNLEELVKQKKFRQDLYYRINVIHTELPPLRDRYEDIPILARHFVDKYAPLYKGKKVTFTKAALDVFVAYSWPGNVRELENVVESIMALCQTDEISDQDLPMKLRRGLEGSGIDSKVFLGSLNFQDAERAFESEMIIKALKKTNYVQTKAAELLGISRRILKYKMDKLGITEMLDEEGVAASVAAVEEGEAGELKNA